MNFFEHFDIPVSFIIDLGVLKRSYYKKSKESHPDFHSLEESSTQEEMLALSSFNNKAYKTLKDENARMKYILELKGMIGEEGENKLPQSFLMEMMDINEEIMELQFDYEEAVHNSVLKNLDKLEENLKSEVVQIMDNYNHESYTKEELLPVKEFYYKQKYLRRIKENLDKLAN